MSHHKEWKMECKVYVGDLGYGAAKQELEDIFGRYGPLRNVWVARNPPGFAFVEFEDPRDAEDSVKALDGTRMNGRRVRVEMSSGKSRNRGGGGRGGRYGGGGGGRSYGGGGGGRRRSRSISPRRRSYSRSRSRSISPRRDRRRSTSSDRRHRRLRSSPGHSWDHPDRHSRDRDKYSRTHRSPTPRENRKILIKKTLSDGRSQKTFKPMGKRSIMPSRSQHHDSIDKRHTNERRSDPTGVDLTPTNNYCDSDENIKSNVKRKCRIEESNNNSTEQKCISCDEKTERPRINSSSENNFNDLKKDESLDTSHNGVLNKSSDTDHELVPEDGTSIKRKRDFSDTHSDSSSEGRRSEKRTKFTSERACVKEEERGKKRKLNGYVADKSSSSDILETSERSQTHS